jgi:DNA primase
MPSFMVSPERQLWRCFGCNKGGSIFDFVMEMEGVEFGDALRMLAQRAGVELKKTDPKLKTERTRVYEICDLANRFFIRQLEASKPGKIIQKYLEGRGLRAKTIKDWQIGYAPNQWRALKDFLNSRGYPDEEILKAGLIVESEKKTARDKYYDRFRDRIIFPIKDLNGVIVGFSGRENPDNPNAQMGKYINTPNTLIYDKSRILYGLDRAKLALRKKNLCIIVEGQTDVIMSNQAGFDNVVASSGTALTEYQLRIIKRYTENLATAFDMDLAGETATKRGIDLALQLGLNVRVISLPDSQDPADCLKNNRAVWSEAVEKNQGLIDFYFNNAFAKNSSETAEGKKEISKALLPVIKRIANKIEQSHWLQELGRRLKVTEAVLAEEMGKIRQDFRSNIVEESPMVKPDNPDKARTNLEEYVLGLVLAEARDCQKYRKEPDYLFTDADLIEIFRCLKKSRGQRINLNVLKKRLPTHLASRVDQLAFRAEAQRDLVEEFSPENEIKICFSQLRERCLREKLNQLNLAIKEAEQQKDKSLVKKLTEDFNKLTKQINFSKT